MRSTAQKPIKDIPPGINQMRVLTNNVIIT